MHSTRSHPVRVDLKGRAAIVAARGPDASGFLQGLLSNDVARASPERAIWAALLTPQGKFLFETIAFGVENDGVRLVIDAERADALIQRLSMYKLRAAVELAREESSTAARFFGAGALERLGLPPERGAARRAPSGAILAVDPRLAELGAIAIGPASAIEAIGSEFERAALDRWDALRIELAVPEARELEEGKALLLESGFEELDGVDFAKGCYVGQEVTARTKWRGLVKKRLAPFRIDGPAPEIGEPALAEGREVGKVRGVAGDRALVLARREAIEAARGGGVLRCGGASLTLELPEWLDRALAGPTETPEPGR